MNHGYRPPDGEELGRIFMTDSTTVSFYIVNLGQKKK
jgi:hypothetical protein